MLILAAIWCHRFILVNTPLHTLKTAKAYPKAKLVHLPALYRPKNLSICRLMALQTHWVMMINSIARTSIPFSGLIRQANAGIPLNLKFI